MYICHMHEITASVQKALSQFVICYCITDGFFKWLKCVFLSLICISIKLKSKPGPKKQQTLESLQPIIQYLY